MVTKVSPGVVEDKQLIEVFEAGVTEITPPAWAKHAHIEMWGGGGSGAKIPVGTLIDGYGGQGGGYRSFDCPVSWLTIDGAFAVSIGTGGAPQTSGTNAAGNDGNNTTITAERWKDTAISQVIDVLGGVGGGMDAEQTYNAASTTTIGLYSFTEAGGQTSLYAGSATLYAGAGGASAEDASSGLGGTSTFGGDGGDSSEAGGVPGEDGAIPGGGGGAAANDSPNPGDSGAGGDGRIRITWKSV